MEITEKVKNLEKEIQEQKLKLNNFEERLKNVKTFINNIKDDNTNYGPVELSDIPTESNKDLEKEIQEQTFKVTHIEEKLRTAETFINDIKSKSNTNSNSVKPPEVPTVSYDNNEKSEVSSNDNSKVLNNPSPFSPVNKDRPNLKNIQSLLDNISDDLNHISKDQNIKTETFTEDDIESWIGKILMGALASLLVFISLITFTKVLLPFLTDAMKITLIFVASFILTATGFIFSQKKPENTLFKALLACGSACIYLSILVTGIHFKAISSIVMYGLIALWAIFILFLKKDKDDWLFFAVGNLGYLVSILFTAGLKDKSLIIPGLIYVVMISIVYQIMFWKNELQRHIQNLINVLTRLLFQIIILSLFNDIKEVIIVGSVTIVFEFIGFIVYLLSDLFTYKNKHFLMAAVNIIAYLVSFILVNTSLIIKYQIYLIFIVVIIPAIILEFITMYWRSKNLAKDESLMSAVFCGFLFFTQTYIMAHHNEFLFSSGILLVAYSLIVVYGIIKKDIFFKIQGWILVGICLFMHKTNQSFILVATLLILSSFIVESVVLNDSEFFKFVSYNVLLIWILRIGNLVNVQKNPYLFEIRKVVIYGIIALLNLVMIKTKFYRTKGEGEEGIIHFVLNVLNLFFMIFGASQMQILDDMMFKIIYTVIVFVLAFIYLPKKENASREIYYYFYLKFAILIYHTLQVFKTPGFGISLGMMAFAVMCIAHGFKNRVIGRELRVVGLMMTLTFVMKFIVVDIQYDNSVLKALNYLTGGMLCFAISAIYNYFEKKQGSSKSKK